MRISRSVICLDRLKPLQDEIAALQAELDMYEPLPKPKKRLAVRNDSSLPHNQPLQNLRYLHFQHTESGQQMDRLQSGQQMD